MSKIKCAIYVRKSTEHGLDMEFNSLQNQEESCKAYIASQAFNGWQYHKTYTDAAISGGTMERPALKQMLDDMAHGLVNTVVVYKVDRLSRSFLDFHNIMREFERHNCNFVSITQAFDTSTSMGKLTLNMLLSFAQFEREVSAERVRDKIRASKAKGFWTGGMPPLGYDIINKKLVPNPTETITVCRIFDKYNELQALNALHQWCVENDIRNKQWRTQKDKVMGGAVFCPHTLNNLLRNPVYIGKIRNKKTNEIYDGLHDGIVPPAIFRRAQEILTENNNRNTTRCVHGRYMLHRKIFDMAGNMFTNKSTQKSQARYYCRPGIYLPAADIERITCAAIHELLDSDIRSLIPADIAQSWKVIDFTNMTYEAKTKLLGALINHITYTPGRMTYYIRIVPIADELRTPGYINQNNHAMPDATSPNADGNTIIMERRVVINNCVSTNRYEACGNNILTVKENNIGLTRSLAYGWRYKNMYERGMTIEEITKTEHKAERTIYKYMALAYLSPKIVSDIMDATALVLDLQTLFTIAAKHVNFKEQEKEFYSKL